MISSNEFGSRETARIIKPLYRYYGSCGREHCVPSTSFITQSSLSASTPLLNGSRPLRAGKCIDARIFTLGVLFIGGLTVGSYLLYQNDRPWPITIMFDFVNREDWGASNLLIGRRLVSDNVVHLLVQHTATNTCLDLTDCKHFVYNYQKMWQSRENIDIPFNFLIGGDGRAYEARGWSIESDHLPIHSNTSLTMAFIGNFTVTNPTEEQINGALALISELNFQRKMSKNYRVMGIRYHRRAHRDAEALFNMASKWRRWDDVFTVY